MFMNQMVSRASGWVLLDFVEPILCSVSTGRHDLGTAVESCSRVSFGDHHFFSGADVASSSTAFIRRCTGSYAPLDIERCSTVFQLPDPLGQLRLVLSSVSEGAGV